MGCRLAIILVSSLAAAACNISDLASTVHYNFVGLGVPAEGTHYQQFATLNDSTVDLGCFVVERRQMNCFDATDEGVPILRPAVVECACPCTQQVADPCDPDAFVIDGTARGTVDHTGAGFMYGGAEFPTTISLDGASEVFMTVEPDDDVDAAPSLNLLLSGELERDGAVLRGVLETQTPLPMSGRVAIVSVEDGAWI